jgi:hypothetical protein
MLGHEKALHEMMQLNLWQTKLVFKELLQTGKINFTELNNEYVKWLEGGNTQKEHLISTLTLHLSLYCGKDGSPGGAHARKLIYDAGLYTGKDGSAFGQQLEDEFGNRDGKPQLNNGQ